jgi:copper chaperone CopZ
MPVIKKTFTVEGMHCGSCAVSIGMILKNAKGVVSARADFEAKTAQVEYDSAQADLADLNQAIEALGYRLKEAQ